jgi:hypothetical protein
MLEINPQHPDTNYSLHKPHELHFHYHNINELDDLRIIGRNYRVPRVPPNITL